MVTLHIHDRATAGRSESDADRARRSLKEHEELRARLTSAEQELAERATEVANGQPSPTRQADALSNLAELESVLNAHFQHEEDGGYMAEVLQLAPRYGDQTERLLAQHASLASELDAISELGASCGQSPERWSQLGSRFATFARHLRAHERAESDIAATVLLDDMGTPG